MSELPTTRAARWRYLWWLILLALGILIGWLLAPKCPHCAGASAATEQVSGSPSQGGAAAGNAGGRPDPGTPDGMQLKGGDGTPDTGNGPRGSVGEGTPIGIGKAKLHPAGDDLPGSGGGSDRKELPADAIAGKTVQGAPADDLPYAKFSQVRQAKDFRYDKTALPRYPLAVSSTGSTFAYDHDSSGSYHSSCAIVTSSTLQEVVDWYKAHLPPGWTTQSAGDLAALGQQVSVDNIMKALTAATQSTGTPHSTTAPASPPASTRADNALRVAMFSAPPGTAGEPSIMIKQAAGQAVQITMSRQGNDP
jgi:hypothetical protein